mmetsp:Transcript_22110/g.29153  ORF Transcript_22110/g.29153 Transcript_22110/m.29153 type:complete len:387 (-) Transcript_22110:53-1213(-)
MNGTTINNFNDCNNNNNEKNQSIKQTIPQYLRNVVLPEVIQYEEILSKNFGRLLYIIFVYGSWIIIFTKGYPLLLSKNQSHVPLYHEQIGYIVFATCLASWVTASYVSPGNVTRETLHRYDNYPHDNLLFVEHQICQTLQIKKIARSKYDKYTHRHIPRFDHYCIWLKSPIGEENYRFFVLFLIVHAMTCCYGFSIVSRLFWGMMLNSSLLTPTFMRQVIVLVYIMVTEHIILACVNVFMFIMSVLLLAFLGFHLYIISNNMTTNEYFKWRKVWKWYEWESKRQSQSLSSSSGKAILKSEVNVSSSSSVAIQHRSKIFDTVVADGTHDEEVAGSTTLNTRKDNTENTIINPGTIPKNIYNLGIVQNVYEVIFPRSRRKLESRIKTI